MTNSVNGSSQCPRFDSIIFGENGKYRATRHGDKVLIQGKDGSLRTTDVDTFMKCLAASLPKMKGQPEKDSFVSRLNKTNQELFDYASKYQEFDEKDNFLTTTAKLVQNPFVLREKKATDGALEKINKSLHNLGAMTLNPVAAVEFWSNPGKY